MRPIDADALFDAMEKAEWYNNADRDEIAERLIMDAPTVEHMQWIPCSERLPEDSGDYLVCPSESFLEDNSEFGEVSIMPYDADCEAFGWWIERYHPVSLGYLDSDFIEAEVIAWMPLPKSYREDAE